jgi:hypothetical protein
VKIELLYFEGCPTHQEWEPRLRGLLGAANVSDPVELVAIETVADAEAHRFLGSPTLRVDGVDFEPGAETRTDFGLKCRLFAVDGAPSRTPPDDWVLAAVGAARL